MLPNQIETTIVLIALVCVAIPFILFLLTQQNTLKAIQPENRDMPPGNVWLQFIPIFNLYYQFVVVQRMSSSIDKEISSRTDESNILPEINPGTNADSLKNIGLTYCILSLCGWVPFIGPLASVGSLLFLIIYWVKLNSFKRLIEGKNSVAI